MDNPQQPSETSEENATLDKIRRFLEGADVSFRELEHAATRTSEESAQARGEALSIGAKALLLKIDDAYKLLILPADRRLDSKAIKKRFRARKVRFATEVIAALARALKTTMGELLTPLEKK